jgi:hypothetical protein
METTLTLDEDVLDKAREVSERLHAPLPQVINEALRLGLAEVGKPARKPYQTIPHDMGLKGGFCLDNIQEVLAQAEGEDFR